MRSNRKFLGTGDKVTLFVINALVIIVGIIVLYPLLYVLSSSISDPEAVIKGEVWLLPIRPTLQGYKMVFQYKLLISSFVNSLIYMVSGTVLAVIVTIMAAYPLSMKNLVGKKFIMALFLFTMFFGGGIIPDYLLINNLGLLNTIWAIILPVAFNPFNIFVTTTFFRTSIPVSLYEASQLDGCGPIRHLWYIVLPLSKAIIAVLVLWFALGHWNSYFSAMLYLKEKAMWPLQIVLREILIQGDMEYGGVSDLESEQLRRNLAALIKYSVVVVASGPMLIIYPFVQQYFVKGVMIGAVKG